MLKSIGSTACFIAFGVFAGPVAAQPVLSGCAYGDSCAALTLLDKTRIDAGSPSADYQVLDTDTLAETYRCQKVSGTTDAPVDTVAFVEDCGPPADIQNVTPFLGKKGPEAVVAAQPYVPAPAPVPVASGLPPIDQIAGATLTGAPTGFVPLIGAAAPFLIGAAGAAGVAVAAAGGGGRSANNTQ